jgi:hypothetical protein
MEAELDTDPFSSTYGLVTVDVQFARRGAAARAGRACQMSDSFPRMSPPPKDRVSCPSRSHPGLISLPARPSRTRPASCSIKIPLLLTGNWVNTIDIDPPTSQVNALPATLPTTSFTVSWAGSDPDSGVASPTTSLSRTIPDRMSPGRRAPTRRRLCSPDKWVTIIVLLGGGGIGWVTARTSQWRRTRRPRSTSRLSSYSINVPFGVILFVYQLNHGGTH